MQLCVGAGRELVLTSEWRLVADWRALARSPLCWLSLVGMAQVAKLSDFSKGIPGWRSGLAPAFGPGRDPGNLGSNPTSGSRCMEPASPSAYVSASLSFSLCDYHK